jgi:glycosyltransferase involved in cell wall biosynthesis
VIVVDDGSTDATPAVLESFGSAIRVLRHDRPRERGASRNAGAAAATGGLLAFLDSDDEWMPPKLEQQLRSGGRATVTGIRTIDGNGAVIGRPFIPPADAPRKLLTRNLYHAGPSSLLIDADLFRSVGGFPEERSLQGSEDWLLMVKLRAAGIDVAVVPEPLVLYRAHEAMSTADPAFVAGAMWSAITWLERSELIRGSEVRTARASHAALISRRYANAGHWRQALVWCWKGVRWGSAGDLLPSVPLVLASGARGALRRRGL